MKIRECYATFKTEFGKPAIRDVVRGFHAGAANTEDNKRKQIDKAKEQPDIADWVSQMESELPAAMKRAFVHKAAKALYDLLEGPLRGGGKRSQAQGHFSESACTTSEDIDRCCACGPLGEMASFALP
ncbi:hypothetical protein CEP54_006903 [Fusarium duplospermum]|uniref:Uncharacterized protein n=1 Tax=Fusarium duplospermum TaxID=1325734 RepID=A0A428Q4J0_9HYPO|nr:hypothetical protein CEP54_006903 [Fusarium duplospermum]